MPATPRPPRAPPPAAVAAAKSCCEENGCCGDAGPQAFGAALYDVEAHGRPARGRRPGQPRLRQPDRRRRATRRRGRARPRLGWRHRRAAVREARRSTRPRLWRRHDGRDARHSPAGMPPTPVSGTRTSSRGRSRIIPLPSESVDVVISNCVVNLSTDKPDRAPKEIFRVLRPGGRDRDHRRRRRGQAVRGRSVPNAAATSVASRAHCRRASTNAGSATRDSTRCRFIFTHRVADGMHSAIVKAVKR